jgi:large subunit ribosomal protein L25
MKQITLNTKPRTEMGRTASRHMRQAGIVPAVIYGESGTHHLTLDEHEFAMAYRKFSGTAALLELKMEGGDAHYAIIQELQRNPRTDAFLHIDFKEIVRGQEMETDIPVQTRGTADGVKNYGGVLEVSATLLRVRCRPRDMPEAIVVDVTELEIGKSIHLSELEAPEGVTFLGDPDLVVVGCVGASAGASGAEEEEAEAEGLEGEAEGEGEGAPEAAAEGEEAAPAASES